MLAGLTKVFASLKDPRSDKNHLYSLNEIWLLRTCAAISGAGGWKAMTQVGQTKLQWLRRLLAFASGIPNGDTLAWVMGCIDAGAFGQCFAQWAASLVSDNDDGHSEVIVLDGETARRFHNRRSGHEALHGISAWACRQQLSLGQLATDTNVQ
ncbi:MAG: ISAs1 family transposase [Gammaproteobacteria bacterium]|nr:ISAs1 family transposase [Gammaproteobacteria bacterium]